MERTRVQWLDDVHAKGLGYNVGGAQGGICFSFCLTFTLYISTSTTCLGYFFYLSLITLHTIIYLTAITLYLLMIIYILYIYIQFAYLRLLIYNILFMN